MPPPWRTSICPPRLPPMQRTWRCSRRCTPTRMMCLPRLLRPPTVHSKEALMHWYTGRMRRRCTPHMGSEHFRQGKRSRQTESIPRTRHLTRSILLHIVWRSHPSRWGQRWRVLGGNPRTRTDYCLSGTGSAFVRRMPSHRLCTSLQSPDPSRTAPMGTVRISAW